MTSMDNRPTRQQLEDLQNAVKVLEEYYLRAVNIPFVRKPIAWALYQTWKRTERSQKERQLGYPVVQTLMPMGSLTYAIACSHCMNRKGSELCDDCMCEVRSGFQLDPDTVKEDFNA